MLPPEIALLVHATHEAGLKFGGIGAVLDGLLSQPAYNRTVRRTVLVGPFNFSDPLELERLQAPGNRLRVLYSSRDGVSGVGGDLARAFERIELYYHITLLYGKRRFGDYEHEVLLIDPAGVVAEVVNDYKYHLWQRYGLDSRRYESSGEYDWYIRAAEPSFAALQAVVGEGEAPRPPALRPAGGGAAVLIAHEWLGLPLAFSARRHQPQAYRTVFYAHEVATVRRLVEDHPGHDTRFYNAMEAARRRGLELESVFGDQRDFFKHALLTAVAELDRVFAVGDLVVKELRFLSPSLAARPIALVYNGVPSSTVSPEERRASKDKLAQYAVNLQVLPNAAPPTWIFTHVTRAVISKGLWRDVRVMEELDSLLAARGETAVLFTLSSAIPAGRRAEEVTRWEAEYDWPVRHRQGNGDLIGPELDYYRELEQFNREARAGRIVLFNQFGWSRERSGTRMPAEMEFDDLRYGSDLEFGQSIYEPFGIGPLEPLASGAVCCLSSVCGALGFVREAGGQALPNVLVADYVTLPPSQPEPDMARLLGIGREERAAIEAAEAKRIAPLILERLPRSADAALRLLEDGRALSRRMSWQVVVEQELLPALLNMF